MAAERAGPGAATEACYRHPREPTRIHCARCERPICTSCMVPAPVGYHCPDCVREARRSFRLGPRRRARALAAASLTTVLLAAILGMFVVEIFLGGPRSLASGPPIKTLVALGALWPPLIARGQSWRLLSAMFLHAGLLHIALNSYALWLFGRFVETTFGRAWFLAIFVLSGFVASAASYAFGPPQAVAVGASGAVVGLLGAFVAYNFRRRHLSLAAANLRWALMIIAINVVFGLSVGSIDNRAHLGGLLAGLLAGAFAEGLGRSGARVASRVVGFALLLGLGVGLTVWRTTVLCDTVVACRAG